MLISYMVLLLIAAIIFLCIYRVKKSVIHISFLIFTTSCFLSLLTAFLANFGVKGAWEFSYVANIALVIMFLTLPIFVSIEDMLTQSEQKYRNAYDLAELYKDLFAHDVNNILQNLRTSLDLLSEENNIEKNPEVYNTIISVLSEQVVRGSKLVSNIRKLSQIEEKGLLLENIDVLKVLDKAIAFIKKNYSDKTLNIFIDSKLPEVYAKGNQLLLDIFEDLFLNAIKFNINSSIDISINISKIIKDHIKYVKINIRDNGIGISNEIKETLLKRKIEIKARIKGLGLGLLLIKKIIDGYNGEISVENNDESDPSKGANFTILIPEVI